MLCARFVLLMKQLHYNYWVDQSASSNLCFLIIVKSLNKVNIRQHHVAHKTHITPRLSLLTQSALWILQTPSATHFHTLAHSNKNNNITGRLGIRTKAFASHTCSEQCDQSRKDLVWCCLALKHCLNHVWHHFSQIEEDKTEFRS